MKLRLAQATPSGHRINPMTTPEQQKILALLAKEWNTTGPPGIMDVSDIVAALSFAPSETLSALKELFTNGLIDMNKFRTSAFLTPEGYAQATHP